MRVFWYVSVLLCACVSVACGICPRCTYMAFATTEFIQVLLATSGQHLLGQTYSGEYKRCIRCATFPLDCYSISCWTIKNSVYKSLVSRRNCAVCVRTFSYKSHIAFRYCCRWSIDRSSSFWMSTHHFASKQQLYLLFTANTEAIYQ